MADTRIDLLQGTLDLLILQTLSLEPNYGWGIAQRIQQVSRDVLCIQQGSLYPALHRLEKQGWIGSEWRQPDSGRRLKYYHLTTSGKKHLEQELAYWDRFSDAVIRVLRPA